LFIGMLKKKNEFVFGSSASNNNNRK